MEIMMDNVVLMFSPIDERSTLQAGRVSYDHTVQSVAARLIFNKFLKRSPASTKPERVLMGLLRLASVGESFNSTRKLKKKAKSHL